MFKERRTREVWNVKKKYQKRIQTHVVAEILPQIAAVNVNVHEYGYGSDSIHQPIVTK